MALEEEEDSAQDGQTDKIQATLMMNWYYILTAA
jgi:hypothetical protein